jgi:hypothetical protein
VEDRLKSCLSFRKSVDLEPAARISHFQWVMKSSP